MTRVALAGESGQITEIVEIGPTRVVRHRTWAGLGPLVEASSRAGLVTTALECGPIAADIAAPDVWLLSDLPRPAADAFGILGRLLADVPGSAGLVMVGGAYSFEGLDGMGGWFDPASARLLPLVAPSAPDATEAPGGVRLVPLPSCPAGLAGLLVAAPSFFGYNKLRPRGDAVVLAVFDDGAPALVASEPSPCRSVAFASDLLPHWGPFAKDWDGLSAFLRELVDLAAGSGDVPTSSTTREGAS
jgi:Putative glutamine amidotransferase